MAAPTGFYTSLNWLTGKVSIHFTSAASALDVQYDADSTFSAARNVASNVSDIVSDGFVIDTLIGTNRASNGLDGLIYYRVKDHADSWGTDARSQNTTVTGTGAEKRIYTTHKFAHRFTAASGSNTKLKYYTPKVRINPLGGEKPKIGAAIKMSLYKWDTDYDTTVAGTVLGTVVLNERWFSTTATSTRFVFSTPVTVTAGDDYLVEFEMADTAYGSYNDCYLITYGTGTGGEVFDDGGNSATDGDVGCSYGDADYIYLPAQSHTIVALVHRYNLAKHLEIEPTINSHGMPQLMRSRRVLRHSDMVADDGSYHGVVYNEKHEFNIEVIGLPRTSAEDLIFWQDETPFYLACMPELEVDTPLNERFDVDWMGDGPEYRQAQGHQVADSFNVALRLKER